MSPALPKPTKAARVPKRIVAQSKRQAAVDRRRSDRLWATAIKAGAPFGRCEFPGCTRTATDAHHVMGKKAHPELRHVLANGFACCHRCHVWVHSNVCDFRLWFSTVRPLAWSKLVSK